MLSLRHTLATLAYRMSRAIENAPPEFAGFTIGDQPKTPGQILAHMGDLLDWMLSLVRKDQKWNISAPLSWQQETARFFTALTALDAALVTAELDTATESRLFQGPIADALTHTGQIAMLRRLAGYPTRSENFFLADVNIGQTGLNSAPPRQPL